MTTLNFGGSWAFDISEPTRQSIIEPIDGIGDFKITKNRSKTSQQYLFGVSQVIDKDSVLQSNMTFGYQSGYLSDPYKLVYFSGDGNLSGLNPDSRPNEKFQWAWLTQYVRHFQQLNSAALHADYRYYIDDWGINAHTMELSWHQPIVDNWQLIPRFRYYSQTQADFYQAVFDSDVLQVATIYSSDYRMAGFGTLSGGIKLSKEFTKIKLISQMKFQTGIEYYDHKANYQLGGNNAGSFNDFSYYMMTASVNLKF